MQDGFTSKCCELHSYRSHYVDKSCYAVLPSLDKSKIIYNISHMKNLFIFFMFLLQITISRTPTS
jgi:hypothetical protein